MRILDGGSGAIARPHKRRLATIKLTPREKSHIDIPPHYRLLMQAPLNPTIR